jgi:hypothetical protein
LPDLYLIFNHKITRLQEEDAGRSLGVERIVELPADLKGIWCHFPYYSQTSSWGCHSSSLAPLKDFSAIPTSIGLAIS